MFSNTGERLLGVSVSFEPRMLCIEFRSEHQAARYKELITANGFVQAMLLNPSQGGCLVAVRLPGRVMNIVASVRCDGFYLQFSDASLAGQWQNALHVWKCLEGDGTKLYVDRRIENRALNAMLGIGEPRRSGKPLESSENAR